MQRTRSSGATDGGSKLAPVTPAPASTVSAPPSLLAPSSLLILVVLFVVSFATDAVSKYILTHLPYPLTLTLAQFVCSALSGAALLLTIHPFTPVPRSQLVSLAPLTCAQVLGFTMTNISFGKLPVSFTHTVKASESLFTALLARVLLGQRFHLTLYLSLIPIVLGVALASMSETSFHLVGFLAAILSNLCFACRSTLASKMMQNKYSQHKSASVSLDDVNLYFWICSMATVLILPVWLYYEGAAVWPHLSAYWIGVLALCGCGHYLYNLCSFLLLSRTSAITHVVMHACRRVYVIFASVWLFGNVLQPMNVAGTVIVMAGVVWFAQEKGKANRYNQASGGSSKASIKAAGDKRQ